MRTGTGRLEHVFVLRMWSEESDRRAEWRASVTHAGTQERLYFTNYEQLLDILEDFRSRSRP